jgi:hypothetical protein
LFFAILKLYVFTPANVNVRVVSKSGSTPNISFHTIKTRKRKQEREKERGGGGGGGKEERRKRKE